MACCSATKKKGKKMILGRLDLESSRLSDEEKKYYKNLFYQHAIENVVSRERFPGLLGLLGTDISVHFANRIFDIFSSDNERMELEDYLKYIDLYHHGSERERCLTTFRLMDETEDNQVDFNEFSNYINLIIGAVRKVHQGAEDDLLTNKEVRILFNKISNDKDFFTFHEFEKIYFEKPLLLSWIDYFKNNDAKFLIHINLNIKALTILLERFNINMCKLFESIIQLNGKNFNFQDITKEIDKFGIAMEKIRKHFSKMNNTFNIRSFIENTPLIHEDQMTSNGNNRTSNKNFTLKKVKSMKETTIKRLSVFFRENNSPKSESNLKNGEEGMNNEKVLSNNPISSYFIPKRNSVESEYSANNVLSENFNTIKEQFNNLKRTILDDNYHYDQGEEIQGFPVDLIIEEEEMENSNRGSSNQSIMSSNKPIVITNSDVSNSSDGGEESMEIYSEAGIGSDKVRQIKKDLTNYECVTDRKDGNNDITIDNLNVQDIIMTQRSSIAQKMNSDSIRCLSEAINFKKIRQPTFDSNFIMRNKSTGIYNSNSNLDGASFYNPNNNQRGSNNIIYSNSGFNGNAEFDKYNEEIRKFLVKMVYLFKNNTFIMKWISSSYKWVEEKYLKTSIKKEKKKEVKVEKGRVNKPISEKAKQSKKHSRTKENILKLTDDSFALLLNMIMGIQITVNSTSNIHLNAGSYLAPHLRSSKYSLPTLNFSSSQLEGTYYISTYGAVIFHNIRKIHGIDKDIFIQSISPQDFVTEMLISSTSIIEELFSTSKSGSLFYHTKDGRYILKTISIGEYKCLKEILPNYFRHMINNKYTLLPKFYGCYKLARRVGNHKSKLYFLVMDNLFSTSREIMLKYDLKGSKLGREVLNKLPEKERMKDTFPFALKDKDLDKQNKKFYIGDKRDFLVNQIKIDTEFLRENNIVDYSLLLGINRYDPNKKFNSTISHSVNSAALTMKAVKPDKFTVTAGNIASPLKKHLPSSLKKERKSLPSQKLTPDYLDSEGGDSHMSLLDYSISSRELESISEREMGNEEEPSHPFQDFLDGGIVSRDGREIYFIGIIDILIKFGTKKKLEFLGKCLYYCSTQMSVVPPDKYRDRFVEYMSSIICKDNL